MFFALVNKEFSGTGYVITEVYSGTVRTLTTWWQNWTKNSSTVVLKLWLLLNYPGSV